VVLDAGHGGHADGAVARDGTKEKDVTLPLARDVRRALPDGLRVVMTRDRDMDAGLSFRVALADTLHADLAVSLHFDAAETPAYGRVPGTQVYGAINDRHGRRAAGVIYQAERRYLDTLGGYVHHRWTHGADHGAIYRQGSYGDYYFLLRESHVPWVISEPLFLTTPREARIAETPRLREGLGRAIAGGIADYLETKDPGSGWQVPTPRPPDPPPPGGQGGCTDPK
jgi:N-acetylmuramoyl-L-alanine amidase